MTSIEIDDKLNEPSLLASTDEESKATAYLHALLPESPEENKRVFSTVLKHLTSDKK